MIEKSILSGLIEEEEYARSVLPHLKEDYFEDGTDNLVFTSIQKYVEDYNGLPTKEALRVAIGDREDLNEDNFKKAMEKIDGLEHDPKTNLEWLTDETEKFCQDRSLYNAVRESILVMDGKHKQIDKGGIPKLLSDALAVSFDNSVGHDFLEDANERFDFYHRKESKIPFDIDLLNKITKGGISKKSLSIILAGTGVGKTLFMTHCASANLSEGKNVLYITMEMAEERIAERIDANLLDLTVDELKEITHDVYVKRITRVKNKTAGKLIIKEYPTASAGSGHFRHLLNELRLKKNFVPDIVYIDYLNICTSSRIRNVGSVNSYTLIKAIAEELRGLAVEFNIPIVSATQTTRSGYQSSDLDLSDTSESFGLPATADFMIGLMSSEDLEALGQIAVKQLKNRWGDVGYYKRFVVGIDRPKMRLYNVEESAQQDMMDDTPTMDKGDVGDRIGAERDEFDSFRGRKKRNNFGDFV